jgi:dTDP-4-amino-4,6-dideoxygalactose transaminase
MIGLFNINNHIINTSEYSNLLHDKIVTKFENTIADYVGAKYAVSFNSATSAIFLLFSQYKNITVKVPSMIPPVVLNAIITSGNKYEFTDDVSWIGDSYLLHEFTDSFKVIDSAQKLEKNQFKNECNPNDLMIFSFYPTKPVGSCDGGIIVSDDLNKITSLRELALNGMSFSENNWDRKIKFPGYKMYMNSIQCDIALKNFNLYENKLEKLNKIRDYYNQNLNYNNTSNHLYRLDIENRDNFIAFMKNNGVLCGIHYDAMHINPVYCLSDSICPNSEIKSKTTVSIPFNENLTDENVMYIIELINKFKHENS